MKGCCERKNFHCSIAVSSGAGKVVRFEEMTARKFAKKAMSPKKMEWYLRKKSFNFMETLYHENEIFA